MDTELIRISTKKRNCLENILDAKREQLLHYQRCGLTIDEEELQMLTEMLEDKWQ